MSKKCIAFEMEDCRLARSHMNLEIIRDYGDYAYGHNLHTWDDGKRQLARCRSCGGLILIQSSEFHSFSDGQDSYYTDYFPITDASEAEELNREYNGFEIEGAFPERYLCMTNGRIHWSR